MSVHSSIHVYLPDELVDVWRPVQAEQVRENIFLIVPQEYDRDLERWQFEPGDLVVCERRQLNGRELLVAIMRATPAPDSEKP